MPRPEDLRLCRALQHVRERLRCLILDVRLARSGRAEDGRPVPPEELARQDRERQQKANEMVQRLARDSSKELARQERELQKARRERDEAMSDIYDVFEIRMIGRERVEEHDTIAFLLTPRRDAKPKTRPGEQIRHFSVRAWVSENDHELVKLEAEGIDNLRLGLGGLQGCPTLVPAPKSQRRGLAACCCQL